MLRRSLALSVCLFGLLAVPADAGLTLFHSPSGNIGCALGGFGARCDIADHTWVAPPKPANCDVDWGGGVAVDKKGKAGWVCAGDTTLHQGNALGYGNSVSQGRFKCKSKQSGVRCVNTGNKHGFFVSRDTVRLF
ncbi:MAG: hypothetical protein QOD60_1586 [Solirubrobacterales bacterium]|nr:hypothetical protein [Solirubrobacterales bacterium]